MEKQTTRDLHLHIIVDNYATHKNQKVKNCLKRNNRVMLRFIPTSSLWLDLIERFFGLITEKAIRRGVFCSVADLEQKLMDCIAKHNEAPVPFVWTKSVKAILEKVGHTKQSFIAFDRYTILSVCRNSDRWNRKSDLFHLAF